MSQADNHDLLRRLASLHGIQTSYFSIDGEEHMATDEALIAMLKALRIPVDSLDDVPAAIAEFESACWRTMVDPVQVVWDQSPLTIEIRLPDEVVQKFESVQVKIFDNERSEFLSQSFKLSESETLETFESNGLTFHKKKLVLKRSIPFGYFDISIFAGETSLSTFLISAPSRIKNQDDETKSWGLFLPLYALKSNQSLGIGDFNDLAEFGRWTGGKGGTIVGALPMLASFLGSPKAAEIEISDEPFAVSPYTPASRLFWNEIFINLHSIPELKRCKKARALLNSGEFQIEIGKLTSTEYVDYAEVMKSKRKVLTELSIHLNRYPSKRRQAFREFLTENPEFQSYARFRAVVEKRKSPWQTWTEKLQTGSIDAAEYDAETAVYHEYVQWIASEQMADVDKKASAAGVGLYLDLPLGTHPSGYDIFQHRQSFLTGVAVGAPPDPLAPQGQNWGFPPLHPQGIRDNHYKYWISVLRHNMKHARVLRIDHVMSLHRLYCIPEGIKDEDGVYISYRNEEMYAILCLEAMKAGCTIIGEDLGTVPDYVRQDMDRHALNRLHVLPFEVDNHPAGTVRQPASNTLTCLNTHDMPPFSAFWEGLQEESGDSANIRQNLIAFLKDIHNLDADVTPQNILTACFRYLATSNAGKFLINLEDLWGETRSQNVPGTTVEQPNWTRKAAKGFEEFTKDPLISEVLSTISRLRMNKLNQNENKNLKDNQYPDSPASLQSAPREGDTRKDNKPVSVNAENSVIGWEEIGILSKDDLYLFNEGSHFRLYRHLGAHVITHRQLEGTWFAVWAPDAERVTVIGDFNGWNRHSHPLKPVQDSGIWGGFIPGISKGAVYKYHIESRFNGFQVDKADPYGFMQEMPPKTASVVTVLDYEWKDEAWMQKRKDSNGLNSPISVYEIHPGSWRRVPEEGQRSLTYRELAPQLIEYVTRLGFTHVEFLPLMEHPFYGSWGYQTTGFFAPTSRYGSPQDFKFLVDSLHQAGIGVILDWVPSHFPNDEHGLGFFDGTHLYEHSDPRKGFHPDWKTYIFNYGRKEVQSFLISSALFWLTEFHVDAIRVDAVASMLYLDYSREEGEWIPNEFGGRENLEAIAFIKRLNEAIYAEHPDVQTIAEESTSFPMVSRPTYDGGLGFGLKWDMGWMHDTLKYMQLDPVYRKYHYGELTFRMIYAFHENFSLPLSHDEVVYGKGSLINKMPGDNWQKFANLRLLFSYMFAQPGKKLLFMGGEFGQWNEWNHDTSLDWHLTQFRDHAGLQDLISELNRLYREKSALHDLDFSPDGFEWINADDSSQSCLSFLRKSGDGRMILTAFNFTPLPRDNYSLGVPGGGGRWREIFNSDAADYNGSGVSGNSTIEAEHNPMHGREFSITITIPPLAAVFLERINDDE